MKDHTEIKPTTVSKSHLHEMYSAIEQQLNIKLTAKGKKSARKDIDRYLLRNNNNIEQTILHFQDYKQRLKNVYLGYSDESLNNVIKQLYR